LNECGTPTFSAFLNNVSEIKGVYDLFPGFISRKRNCHSSDNSIGFKLSPEAYDTIVTTMIKQYHFEKDLKHIIVP
jgi:hypothetical protein